MTRAILPGDLRRHLDGMENSKRVLPEQISQSVEETGILRHALTISLSQLENRLPISNSHSDHLIGDKQDDSLALRSAIFVPLRVLRQR
jgi:hypothetical protein